jgi:Tfp pilus assembly protein PilX
MKNRVRSPRYSRGIVLPIVLLMSSMLLVTAAAWLEAALVSARTTTNLRDRVQAFHSADSALIRCARIALDSMPEPRNFTGTLVSEPDRWRLKASFEGASAKAVTPFATWPHTIRPPQCLIEAWAAQASDHTGAFLITARGFGRTAGSESWLQQQIEIGEGGVVRHWRRIVAKPFQGSSP